MSSAIKNDNNKAEEQRYIPDPSKWAIEVPNLNFDFGGPLILDQLHLKVERGSSCLLVGANGAGKSTLLRILAGKRLIHGEAFVLGQRAFLDRPGGVTYLGTEWAANPATRLDIQVGYLIKSVGGDRYPERRDQLIRLLDVDVNWRMHQVSDGERRRVQLVIGLLVPWEVLLLDEVTVDLDVRVRANLFHFLKAETINRQVTILYATHIFDGLGNWPTHIAHIHRGKILSHDKLNEFDQNTLRNQINEQTMQEAMQEARNSCFQSFKRLSGFQELFDAVAHTQTQLKHGVIPDSPLLKLVERWLREDFQDRLNKGDLRGYSSSSISHPNLWDALSEDVDQFGDKYYNYWR